MTTTPFTPGPWEIAYAKGDHPYQLRAPNGRHVDRITRWGAFSVPSLPEGQANARLIAASPDLYAACVEAEACMTLVEPRSDKAEYLRILGVLRAAIARAEGRTP